MNYSCVLKKLPFSPLVAFLLLVMLVTFGLVIKDMVNVF